MNAPFHRRHRSLALLVALIGLALCVAPAPQARAQTAPDWFAWNLKVDFPGAAPRVVMTSYQGVDGTLGPAVVTSASAIDISGNCRSFGGVTVGGGKAIFAANGYIKCLLPTNLLMSDQCTAEMSPFYWAATKVQIDPTSTSNPIFEVANGSSAATARFSLPRSGAKAQTLLTLPGASYLSAKWNIGADNRVIMGSGGPSIVSIADYFAADGWLGFLTKPGWQDAMNALPANKVGNWSEPQMIGWQGNRVLEGWPQTRYIYIGHSPSAGTYFTGTMWGGEFDPGCTAK